MKINCWDYNQCGRELGGEKVKESGVCPAVTFTAYNQTNGGFNGGRFCWEIAGTFPEGETGCSHASELPDCSHCGFYQLVYQEEGSHFVA